MKVFCKAKKFLGDEIEEKMLCESVGWLIENQRNDGAFPEVHHVIHREMVVRREKSKKLKMWIWSQPEIELRAKKVFLLL